MFTRESLTDKLLSSPDLKNRLAVLHQASALNPDFRHPHVVGGYLRNLVLDRVPNDCDVVFQGNKRDQSGVLESVRQAENKLGIAPYENWEFENSSATGYSGDFYADNIGRYSYHTDYLTKLMMDTSNHLYIGIPESKVLEDLSTRTYDLDFQGVKMWVDHRGAGRSYDSCLTGDLIRAIYFTQSLGTNVSSQVEELLLDFDTRFNSLDPDDQAGRIRFWLSKTKGDIRYQPTLEKYSIHTLPILV